MTKKQIIEKLQNAAKPYEEYYIDEDLIPKFEKLIATIRSREISASIILQAQSQLKAILKTMQIQ